jgi:hypothetical protein
MPYAYWLLSDGQTGKNYICTDAYFAKELNFVIYILSDWLAAGQAGSTAEQCSRTVQRKVRSPSIGTYCMFTYTIALAFLN